jgi:hypothetical protein
MVVILGVVAFYAWEAKRWLYPSPEFSEQERGVAILALRRDESDLVQAHLDASKNLAESVVI